MARRLEDGGRPGPDGALRPPHAGRRRPAGGRRRGRRDRPGRPPPPDVGAAVRGRAAGRAGPRARRRPRRGNGRWWRGPGRGYTGGVLIRSPDATGTLGEGLERRKVPVTTLRLIGPGRAGRSLAAALADAGCDVRGRPGAAATTWPAPPRGVDVRGHRHPRRGRRRRWPPPIAPVAATVVVHLSGALGLDVLAPHRAAGVAAPARAPALGRGGPGPAAQRHHLRRGRRPRGRRRWRRSLGGRCVVVDDDHRAAYHAAACIAANHVVALLGQVERVAASAGLGLDAFVGLAAAALHGRGRPRPGRRPHRPGGPGRRGHPGPAPRRARPRASSPATTPAWPWPAGWRAAARRRPPPAHPDDGARGAPWSHRARSRGAGSPTPSRPSAPSGGGSGLVPTMGALHAGHRSLVGAGRGRVRRRGRHRLREPAAVRRRRRPGRLPPRPRRRRGHGRRRPAPASSSPRRWRRCTRASRPRWRRRCTSPA